MVEGTVREAPLFDNGWVDPDGDPPHEWFELPHALQD